MNDYLMNYAKYIQYPLLITIVFYSFLSLRPIKKKEITLVLWISFLGVISYVIGVSSNAIDPNIRAILVPFIFLIVVNSRSDRLLKYIFWYCLTFAIFEEILFFSGLTLWTSLDRFGFLRPYGGFFDGHLSGLFIASTLFLFGKKYLGAFITIIFLALQTPIAYSLIFINKRTLKFALLFSGITIYFLYSVGHLKVEQKDSMINAYLSFNEYSFDYCYLLGCSSNIINTEKIIKKDSYRFIDDVGLFRVLYFFGAPWLLFYTYFIIRRSKSKVLPLMYLVTILHYPIVFGVLTTALLAISINYYNRHISPKTVV